MDWCQREFGLYCLGSDLRGLNGAELFGLNREAFQGLISDCTAGEILWEHLEDMRGGKRLRNTSFTCRSLHSLTKYYNIMYL